MHRGSRSELIGSNPRMPNRKTIRQMLIVICQLIRPLRSAIDVPIQVGIQIICPFNHLVLSRRGSSYSRFLNFCRSNLNKRLMKSGENTNANARSERSARGLRTTRDFSDYDIDLPLPFLHLVVDFLGSPQIIR